MNMFKKNGGFTLVELIVVIAILAILAAVAVPAYTGYIAKAEEAADLQMLSSIKTAVLGQAAEKGETIKKIEVHNAAENGADAAAIELTVTNADDEVVEIDEETVKVLTGDLNTCFDADFKGSVWFEGQNWKAKAHNGACVDTSETPDHKCDTNGCGLIVSTMCADGNNDHKCDVCTTVTSSYKDDNNDNACDICGQAKH